MATDWTTQADLTFSDQDLWKAKVSGQACDPFDFKGVAEAPENMLLDPEDYDIFPEQIQVDNESWVTVTLTQANAPSWTTVYSGTDD